MLNVLISAYITYYKGIHILHQVILEPAL